MSIYFSRTFPEGCLTLPWVVAGEMAQFIPVALPRALMDWARQIGGCCGIGAGLSELNTVNIGGGAEMWWEAMPCLRYS